MATKKLPRTIVVFVLDTTDVETLVFLNSLEGSENHLPGIGIVEVVTILQFQAVGAKGSLITFMALVEYKKLRDEEEDVLDANQDDSSVPSTGEVVGS